MQGKIIKGIAGFYYVQTVDDVLYECKAKGSFRKDDIKPLVGDNVEISILDAEHRLGNIEDILERKNKLIRPEVANVDGALVIFAVQAPDPNYNLLDRFLIMMEQQELPCIICFNKKDIVSQEEQDKISSIYAQTGYELFFTSALQRVGIERLKERLSGGTWTVAGPSGVGKSSLINTLQDKVTMETGAISIKTERGKQTTRHSELILIDKDTYIMDTPGFSSLSVFNMEKEDLRFFYPEFNDYENTCKYTCCTHTHEPGCSVIADIHAGKLNHTRYDNYLNIFEELKNQKKFRRTQ